MGANQTPIEGRILRELQEIRDRLSQLAGTASGSTGGVGGKDAARDQFTGVLDALAAHLALLDDTGVILHTNRAWRRFARDNGMPEDFEWAGANYLQVCQGATGEDAAARCPVRARFSPARTTLDLA